MHERRFNGGADRLRTPERIALLEVERVAKLSAEEKSIQKVLDIGTGSGLFAEAFASLNKEVTGIDVSDEMIKTAKDNLPSAKFEKALAEEIPYPDNAFDLAFMGLVLHEADDLLKALKEARRVAKERVAILEWPYTEGEYGPPLEHRIKPEVFAFLINEAGYKSFEKVELKNLLFYKLKP